jgi:hypothetical protein
MSNVIAWDIETAPDLNGFAARVHFPNGESHE